MLLASILKPFLNNGNHHAALSSIIIENILSKEAPKVSWIMSLVCDYLHFLNLGATKGLGEGEVGGNKGGNIAVNG